MASSARQASCAVSWGGGFTSTRCRNCISFYDNSIERGASLSLLINQANALSDQTPEE